MRSKLAVLMVLTLAVTPPARAEDKWNGQIPKAAEKPEDWAKLIPTLVARGLPYGALAGSRAALNFFADLPTKELAYGTIVNLVDAGYPFSTRGDFVPGDLDAGGKDPFNQSYLLYKGMVNVDKNMGKWAEYYFNKIDKDTSPKWLFYQANLAYADQKLPEAIALLKRALAVTQGPALLTLAKKEARTLARLHYERGEFDRALDVYQSFLLKVDPITPTDWIESAWTLYQLKKFPEALGALYNFDGKSVGPTIPLEKYVLRGLIYREFCATASTEALLKNFDREFGATITGIKTGEALASFPQLLTIDHPEAQEYRQYSRTLSELEREAKLIPALPKELRAIATYVYDSETAMLKRGKQYHQDHALEALARHLVIMGESLRFLKFDVAREKFSPDRVFAEAAPTVLPKLVESTDDKNFRLHWLQWGDYWRDERNLYRGLMRTKCER